MRACPTIIRPILPLIAALMAAGAAPAPPTAPLSPDAIVAAAPAGDWRTIAPEDLLVMTLAGGRRVVIELAPRFAPAHVAAIRALAQAGRFDAGAIVRVQDDYVVQWAIADESRPLPVGIAAPLPPEYERPRAGLAFTRLPYPDSYAPQAGYADGWPVASDGRQAWLTHCYAMVGVGRDQPPDNGTGEELYAVIGQAPRHLDRNIALVGRVIDGMDALSALPRGTGDLGFYRTPGERTPITRVRLASNMPADARPAYQVMRTDGASFSAYWKARADRRDAFFVRPANGLDVCNAPVPVRPAR